MGVAKFILQAFLTYVVLPIVKNTIGLYFTYQQMKKENAELRAQNSKLIEKFKEAKGVNALNTFNQLP